MVEVILGFIIAVFGGAIVYGLWASRKMGSWPLMKIIGKLPNPPKLLRPKEFREELNRSNWGLTREAIYESIRTKTCIICGGDLIEIEAKLKKGKGRLKGLACIGCGSFYST